MAPSRDPSFPATTPAPGAGSEHRARGEALRLWGQTHPFLHDVLERIPGLPRGPGRNTLGNGLYVEAAPGPWGAVKGTLRVSLLRVHSVTADGMQLVGQVHATQPATGHGAPVLRFYVHDAEAVVVREVRNPEEWWLELLDRHYLRGGPLVEAVDTGVTA